MYVLVSQWLLHPDKPDQYPTKYYNPVVEHIDTDVVAIARNINSARGSSTDLHHPSWVVLGRYPISYAQSRVYTLCCALGTPEVGRSPRLPWP